MKIGILGAGNIGATLANKLAAAGHEVTVAHSGSPDTIPAKATDTGARPVTVEEVLQDVEVAILSMPQTAFEKVKPLVAALPEDVVVIDTSNYFPQRDGEIAAIEAGQVESEWVQETLGRPITKAWNAVGANVLADKGRPSGDPERGAVPISGDRSRDREVAIALVNDTGFDGFDAGPLADSWRQQPGSPVYCTNLALHEIAPALAAAERDRLADRRNLAVAVFAERFGAGINPDADTIIRISRALQM
ncbi:hypothetical protein IQ22_04601 [Pseudomonas duriflava]|uniref:Pyrroline-5-carboxylate reductase catalytic N-terminal domain-containing protein n=1 Tax=Pseudomonas duriflava TaxID=459528 RepID=A0A562PN73_9PSED|nr:NAD(P)-binding domain-containing protein [Pseudomonas duriflava]TWI45650.1 hypothetical protein IQ22_04601 [Pseudomonas duriflava]